MSAAARRYFCYNLPAMFKNRLHVCDLFGIPLYLDVSFAVLLLFFCTSYSRIEFGLMAALVLVLSVVLHELGHSLTARLFGYRTQDITVSLLGGCAALIALPRRPWQELLTALAGPAVSFALAGLGFALLPLVPEAGGDMLLFLCLDVMWTNFMLGAFNLLPGFPMDGGRVFRSILSTFISRARATLVAMWVGRAFAVLLALSWVVPALLAGDYFVLLLLFAVVVWVAGDRVLPPLLGLWMPAFKAQLLAVTLRPVLALVLGVVGLSCSSGEGFGVVRLLIAWMIWREGYREYQQVRLESAWPYADFRAHASPPPYGGDDQDADVTRAR